MDNLKLIEGSIYYNNGCNFENYTYGWNMFEIQLCEFMEDIMKFDQDILRGRFFFETENYLYCELLYYIFFDIAILLRFDRTKQVTSKLKMHFPF